MKAAEEVYSDYPRYYLSHFGVKSISTSSMAIRPKVYDGKVKNLYLHRGVILDTLL
jgi:hypothetical protein